MVDRAYMFTGRDPPSPTCPPARGSRGNAHGRPGPRPLPGVIPADGRRVICRLSAPNRTGGGRVGRWAAASRR